MNINDLSIYGKKVWRPGIINNYFPVIDVVTNLRNKKYQKQEYELKINNIEMHGKTDFVLFNNELFTDLSITADDISTSDESFNKYSQQSNVKLQLFNNKNVNEINKLKYTAELNCSMNNNNDRESIGAGLEVEQNCFKTVKIIKKEKKIGKKRKVYLKWSKYSSSNCIVNTDTVMNANQNIKIKRKHYLLTKYWNLWKKFAKNRSLKNANIITPKNFEICLPKQINRGNSEDNLLCRKRAVTSGKNNRFMMRKRNSENDLMKKILIKTQKQKIEEQSKTIRELQIIRLKLEEEKFKKETQELLEENKFKRDRTLKSTTNSTSFSDEMNIASVNDANKYKESWEFVTRMEVRATERKKRWDVIKERKEELEKEKLAKIKFQEERKKKLEEEEKKRKILQMKQEKRRQEELRKKQEEERLHLNTLNGIAMEHYQMKLLTSSLNYFKITLKQRKLIYKQAKKYYDEKILLRFFFTWKLYYRIQISTKLEKAKNTYDKNLLKRGFNCFKLIRITYMSNIQVAVDYYDFSLLKNYFYLWRIYLHKQKHELMKKENTAIDFCKMKLLQHVFQCWKDLPQILFHEREKEQRIRLWCNKVQELLPDFEPSHKNYCS